MANIEFINKRIAGKQAEITKLEKKLERINAAKATGWEKNPYYYNDRDLYWATKELETAKTALAEWQAKLATEQEKAASRNVQVILDFLAMWKKRVYDYYAKGLHELDEAEKAVKALYNPNAYWAEEEYEDARKQLHREKYGEYIREYRKTPFGTTYLHKEKTYTGKFEWLQEYFQYTLDEALARLTKELDDEANRKYDFIIERTNAIVGTITDASGLTIGAKQDLNGFIIGTNGVAKVETIGAGGYNIQCYHFRTLIHRKK